MGVMMETREQKVARLAELKAALVSVEGTQTEVYSRIVGYYRSVRNWNAGKREEFGQRVEFSFPAGSAVTAYNSRSIVSYILFAREACPNCPPVKEYLSGSLLSGSVADVDTEEGLDLARQYEVLSTPTAILLDAHGEEVTRARSREQLEGLLETVAEQVAESAIA